MGKTEKKLGEILKGISSTVRASENFGISRSIKAIRVEANEIETYLKEEKENAEVVDFYRTKKGRESYPFSGRERHFGYPSHVCTGRVLFQSSRYSHKEEKQVVPSHDENVAVVKDMVKKLA